MVSIVATGEAPEINANVTSTRLYGNLTAEASVMGFYDVKNAKLCNVYEGEGGSFCTINPSIFPHSCPPTFPHRCHLPSVLGQMGPNEIPGGQPEQHPGAHGIRFEPIGLCPFDFQILVSGPM